MALVTTTVDKIKTTVPNPLEVNEYAKKSPEVASELAGMQVSTDVNNQMFDELVGGLAAQSKEMMTGAIPSDVQDQIRQLSAENTLKGGQGMGSQASKFIAARDLGLTSLDIMQKGQALADSTAKLAEAKREYNKTYALNLNTYLNDVRKVDVTEAELRERSRQFNVTQNNAVAQLLSQSLAAYHDMGVKYASIAAQYGQDNASSVADMNADFGDLLDLLRKYTVT